VESVEFQRYAGGQGSTKNFDLCVNLKTSVTGGTIKDYTFSGIDRSDYAGLYNFLSGKKIPIKNMEQNVFAEEARPSAPVYNEDEIYGGPDMDGGDDGSEDESYGDEAAAKDEAGAADDDEDDSEDDMDDDEMGSEIDDELDSDLEEARKSKKGKRSKKAAAANDDEEDDEEEVESPKKKQKKKAKPKKDPKAPKKAMTSYMLYANAARAQVVSDNPEAGFGEITKIAAAQWKQLSPEERAKWDAKASKDKTRYAEEMEDYSAPEDSDNDGDDTKKGKQKGGKEKAKKDPNKPKQAMSSFFFFMNKNRDRIKEENPDVSFGEVVRTCYSGSCKRRFPRGLHSYSYSHTHVYLSVYCTFIIIAIYRASCLVLNGKP
jgi:hypothetical protein